MAKYRIVEIEPTLYRGEERFMFTWIRVVNTESFSFAETERLLNKSVSQDRDYPKIIKELEL